MKTIVYIVNGQPDKIARPACLGALIKDLCDAEAERLVLEQDDSLAAADRRIIHTELKARGNTGLEYRHMRRARNPCYGSATPSPGASRKADPGGPRRNRSSVRSAGFKCASLARHTIRKTARLTSRGYCPLQCPLYRELHIANK